MSKKDKDKKLATNKNLTTDKNRTNIEANKIKNRRLKWILTGVFLLGFLIAVYPLISQYYYRQVAINEVKIFDDLQSKLDEEEIKNRIRLANAYNRSIDPTRIMDPFTEEEKEGRREYAKMLELEEKIGHIEIPQIGEDLPVYAGTSMDILERGAGHLEGTSLPVGGPSTHAVVTAHRGLPKAKLFTDLNKLKEGDVFFFHNIEGVLAYEVDSIMTVEPDNFDPVLIQPGRDLMTLLTCTPYMINSHRLLVTGHRVEYTENITINKRAMSDAATYREYLRIALAVIFMLVLIYIVERVSLNKMKKIFRENRNRRDGDEK